ncbi:PAS domain-containing protein [Sinorhizobium americanum]|uniref:DNA-binding CsgD family transcriptional regulator n=1 Tax=Sinorhizobium americanum TaxID=194963 RepID=A0A4R2BRY3_9HYPH|nr:PAS domain-containing protein [Sinorhizobium americanum]TCN30206.1 DNA-binding CsgD family transcriptional regulator [Sinorhizobium americanum]
MGAAIDVGAIGVALINAVIEPSGWHHAMDIVEKATGSVGAMLFDMKNRLPDIPRSRSMELAFESYVHGGWIQRDERYRLTPILVQRGVTTELDLITPEEIARSAYYQEFLAPLGLRWYAAVKVAASDQFWALSLQRSIEQGPFSPGEVRQLAEVSKELAAVAALSRALGIARAEAALDAFSASGTAVVMIDRQGDVLRVNSAAEKLFGIDLQVTRKRIVPRDRNAAAALDRSLRELLWQATPPTTRTPVLLPRGNRRPLLAYPMRLSGVSVDAFSPCQAVVVFVDPDACPPATEAVLKNCLGLTTAEARLALRLSAGETVECAAEQMKITQQTARNQLKSVFAKTGTHRQAELALLLARLGNQYLRDH